MLQERVPWGPQKGLKSSGVSCDYQLRYGLVKLNVRSSTFSCTQSCDFSCRIAAGRRGCIVGGLQSQHAWLVSLSPFSSSSHSDPLSCLLVSSASLPDLLVAKLSKMSINNDVVTLVEMPYSAATSRAPSMKDGTQTPKTISPLTESDLIDYTLYLPPQKVALIVVSLGLSFFICVLECVLPALGRQLTA